MNLYFVKPFWLKKWLKGITRIKVWGDLSLLDVFFWSMLKKQILSITFDSKKYLILQVS